MRQRPSTSTTYRVVNDYAGDATRVGAYAAARLDRRPRRSRCCPACASTDWTLTDRYHCLAVAAGGCGASSSAHAAARRDRPLPAVPAVSSRSSARGARRICSRSRRSISTSASSRRSAAAARVQVTVYDREERDMLRRPGAETRLVDGRLRARLRGGAVREPRSTASSRGVEVMLQRLDSSGFSGWISYSYGRNRYRDVVTGESLLGRSRSAPHAEPLRALSAVAAHQRQRQAARRQQLSGARLLTRGRRPVLRRPTCATELRLPSFARLDLRANRTFTWADAAADAVRRSHQRPQPRERPLSSPVNQQPRRSRRAGCSSRCCRSSRQPGCCSSSDRAWERP